MSLTGAALAGVALLGRCGAGAGSGQAQDQMPAMPAASRAAPANPNLDLGTSLGGRPAPDFRLDNQFGQPMSLSQFHGKVVITEPSAQAVRAYLRGLGGLRYPVGLDIAGRVAGGYGVQDQPWFALVSASGKIVWSHDGWLSAPALEAQARRA